VDWHTRLRPDALVEIDGPKHKQQYAVEVKNVDRFDTLQQARALWPRQAKPALLIAAPYVTAQAAERCRMMDLYFADTAGNVYLRGPGLHLYVTGKRKATEFATGEERKITNPAGLKVVFTLLCKPDLLNATYRQIAAAAGVALGTVGPVMAELEVQGHIAPAQRGERSGRRRFLDAPRLVQEWVAVYPKILRPKLNRRRFQGPPTGWAKDLDLRPHHAMWGGEVAANRLLHHLEPEMATIYAEDTPKRLIAEKRLKADVRGDVEILDRFWNTDEVPGVEDVVPPLLVYADLAATTDGRNLEAAKMIYEQFIESAFRNQAWPD